MANIKQQKKRIRVAERQRMENIRYRSSIKTAFRRVVEAVQSGDAEAVASAHATFVALVDRAAAKRALHPNTAARKKARVTRVSARGPQAEESKKRRGSKTAAPAQKAAPVEEAVAEEAVADEPAADDDVIEEAAEAPADEPEAAADASADAPEAEAGDDAAPADDES
ncbi:MAG: 30S ribosomal protein S20 [Actinomycetota bacterium]